MHARHDDNDSGATPSAADHASDTAVADAERDAAASEHRGATATEVADTEFDDDPGRLEPRAPVDPAELAPATVLDEEGVTAPCVACAAPLPAAALFCMRCGAPAPGTRRSCVVCTEDLAPGDRFCSTCGAPVAAASVVDDDEPVSVATASAEPAATPPHHADGRPKTGVSLSRVLIGLAAVGALIVATLVAVLLLLGGSDEQPQDVTTTAADAPSLAASAAAPMPSAATPGASDTLPRLGEPADAASPAVTPAERGPAETPEADLSAALIDMTATVARQHRGVVAQLAAIQPGKTAPLRLARTAGTNLATTAKTARAQTANSFPSASDTDLALRRDLSAALAADAALGRAVATLPTDTDDLKTGAVGRIETIAADSDSAWRQLRDTIASTAPSTPKLGVPPAADAVRHVHVVAEQVAEQQRVAAEMRGYVSRMEGILSRSSGARSEITAVQGNLDRCDPMYYAPDMAYDDIQRIAAQREALAVEASGVSAPTTEAALARDQLVSALRASAEANYARADWVSSIADWWYTFPVGCYGSTPRNGYSDAMEAADSRATSAKQAFVGTYNAFAPSYGGQRWSSGSV